MGYERKMPTWLEDVDVPKTHIGPYPFVVALAFDEERYNVILDALGQKDKSWMDENDLAYVLPLGSLVVVALSEDFFELSSIEQAGCIAHESVHVFQHLCKYISERKPSAEFSAYTIQAIVEWTLKETEKWTTSNSSPEQLSLDLPGGSSTTTPPPSEN